MTASTALHVLRDLPPAFWMSRVSASAIAGGDEDSAPFVQPADRPAGRGSLRSRAVIVPAAFRPKRLMGGGGKCPVCLPHGTGLCRRRESVNVYTFRNIS